MRVLVTGSHSTGKTSLVEACAAALEDRRPNSVDVIPEVARKVIAAGFPMGADATLDSYVLYIGLQLAAQRQATRQHVISDRGMIDILAYMRANANADIPDHFAKLIEELVHLEKGYFDLYCYLPMEFPMVPDNARSSDEEYRHNVDRRLVSVLSEYQVPVKNVTGTLRERREKLLQSF